MKKLLLLLSCTLFLLSCSNKKGPEKVEMPDGKGIEKAEKVGLKLALNTSTFPHLSLTDVFEKANEIEVKYIEVKIGCPVNSQTDSPIFSPSLSSEQQANIKNTAQKAGLKTVGIDCTDKAETDSWGSIFAFAKSMDVEYITCNPALTELDSIEELATRYSIKVGLNNTTHSAYSTPESLLSSIAQRSPLLGSCANPANWNRAGIDQIEALEKLSGRIISLYIRDIDKVMKTDTLKDAKWGEGILDIDSILIELKKQKYAGYLAIIYQTDDADIIQKLKDSIFYYDLVTDYIL